MSDNFTTRISSAVSSAALQGLINTACFLNSDKDTVGLARRYALSDKPLAQEMLDHYLKGGGTDVAVDTERLMREDPALAKYVIKEIKASTMAGSKEGNVAVSQDKYSQQDWRNALGSINMQWKVVDGGAVEIWFVNLYRWHPSAKRVTQCVHKAADNLKASGAAEFKMIGSRHRISLS